MHHCQGARLSATRNLRSPQDPVRGQIPIADGIGARGTREKSYEYANR
jgi:hypothetical protein